MLERMVHTQISSYINDNELLSNRRHGFTLGRSTLTNLLKCDAVIADVIFLGHSYDILSYAFVKVFDKAPHSGVLSTVAEVGVSGKALEWLLSFLTNRTFRVRVSDSLHTRTHTCTHTYLPTFLYT